MHQETDQANLVDEEDIRESLPQVVTGYPLSKVQTPLARKVTSVERVREQEELRLELQQLSAKALRERAATRGIANVKIEEARQEEDVKSALIELIIEDHRNVDALRKMKKKDLLQYAVACGVPKVELEVARDHDEENSNNEAVIAMVVAARRSCAIEMSVDDVLRETVSSRVATEDINNFEHMRGATRRASCTWRRFGVLATVVAAVAIGVLMLIALGNTDLPSDADCNGSWSKCSFQCEAGGVRTWIEEIAQSGAGQPCPPAHDCAPGEDSCPPLKSLTAALVLNMDINSIPPGSPERQVFEMNFRNGLASALGGISAVRIQIVSILGSSIFVNFVILPGLDGSSLDHAVLRSAFADPAVSIAGVETISAVQSVHIQGVEGGLAPICTPFSTTFPQQPAGYIVPNMAGTTMSELGGITCADGFTGVAATFCNGDTFAELSGCQRIQPCVGSWSTCQADCADKIYTIEVPASAGGASCEALSGATAICAPGQDDCGCLPNFFYDGGNCVSCPFGTFAPAGIYPNCMCAEDFHVEGGVCVRCPQSTPKDWHRTQSDDPSLGDTTCTPYPLILVVGGQTTNNDESAVATTEVYDVSLDTWSSADAMGTPRTGHVLVKVGSNAYAIGGTSGLIQLLASAEVFDVNSIGSGWRPITPMRVARSGAAGASVGNKIYVMGGYTPITWPTSSHTAEVYDVNADSWSPIAPMNLARLNFAAAAVGTAIYVMGGTVSYDTGTVEEMYSVESNSWTPMSSMAESRYNHAAAVIGDQIYVAGGIGGDHHRKLATVEVYDTSTDTWSSATELEAHREHHAMATIGSSLFVLGGYSGTHWTHPPLDTVVSATFTSSGTHGIWVARASMDTPRQFLTTVAFRRSCEEFCDSDEACCTQCPDEAGDTDADCGAGMESRDDGCCVACDVDFEFATAGGACQPYSELVCSVAGSGFRTVSEEPLGTADVMCDQCRVGQYATASDNWCIACPTGQSSTVGATQCDWTSCSDFGACNPDNGISIVEDPDSTFAPPAIHVAYTVPYCCRVDNVQVQNAACESADTEFECAEAGPGCHYTGGCNPKYCIQNFHAQAGSCVECPQIVEVREEIVEVDLRRSQGDDPSLGDTTCTPYPSILVAGGSTWAEGPIVLATTEVYDVTLDTWSSVDAMGTPRTGHVLVKVGSNAYAIGGMSGPDEFLSSAEVFDVNSIGSGWRPITPMSVARSSFAGASVGNKIYVMGGFASDSGWMSSAEVYDVNTDSWNPIANMSSARYQFAAAAVGTNIYVMGGTPPPPFTADVAATAAVYSIDSNSWNTIASMAVPRRNHAAAVIGSHIYVVGGSRLAAVELYDTTTDAWRSVRDLETSAVADPPRAASPRERHQLLAIESSLFVVGGYDGSNFYDPPLATVKSSVRTGSYHDPWVDVASMATARQIFAAVEFV